MFAVSFTENKVSDNTYDQTKDVFPIDLDEDGDIDIVSVSDVKNDISWWENNGSQSFTERTIDGSHTDPYSVFSIDLDGDLDLDVVACSADSGDKIVWYKNDGSENFTTINVQTSYDCTTVVAADMNGDLKNDLITASYGNSRIDWWENSGSGSFTRNAAASFASVAWDVVTGDIDGDGDIDIAGAIFGLYDIVWLDNNGSGTFVTNTIDSNLEQAHSVFIADLDEDGDKDILATGRLADDVVWYDNDGSESFTKKTIDANLDGASDVTTGDIDGDGDIDVASVGQFGNILVWYDNDGSESFTRRTVSSSFDGAYRSVIYDVDKDGDNDIVASGNTNNDDGVTWYSNLGDSVAPTVSSLSPVDGATGVSTTGTLVITFSEEIGKSGTGSVSIYKTGDDSLAEAIYVTGSLVSGSGTTILTIDPSIVLIAGTSYYVQISLNAFPDITENSYAGISDTTSWNFTTAGTAPSSSTTARGHSSVLNRLRNLQQGEEVRTHTEPPSLEAVGIFRMNPIAVILSKPEEENSEVLGSAEEERIAHILYKLNNHLSAPEANEAPLSPADTGIETDPFTVRVCARVHRSFSENRKMLERVNGRLERRFGFVCEE
ncbi:hypothetical protein COU78_02440 [Candidatus Peregrinibacteria bacterium CG10_big_fil_rev_8_21_14_0_10_49_24]|nr:MAG: hypothetical protein COU78_02440 [Candidatus Peregrinibacteria bacterium CG10_big_fil_rev_8_21_14_0_10_49_24]